MDQFLGQSIEIFYKVKQEFINNCPCMKNEQQPDPSQAYGEPKPQMQQATENGGVYEMQPYATENGTVYTNPNEMQYEDDDEGFDEFKTSEKISEWQAGWCITNAIQVILYSFALI